MIRLLRLDTSGVELQLSRIADALEGLRDSTNPPYMWDTPDGDQVRAFYCDENREIVEHHLRKMGKKPK